MMAGLTRRRRFVRPLAVGFGALLGALALLIVGWLVWSLFRPPPTGFAPTTGEAVGVVGQPSDIFQYTIDARSRSDWVYFDFSRGTVVPTVQANLDWDLALRRNDIRTNGGETNPDGVGGAVDLGEIPLVEAVPPVDGYVPDTSDEENNLENPALDKWYNYNWTTHIVTSKNHTYAVRTATGEVALLTFVSYYCDDGSSGCVTIRYVYPIGP